MKITGIWVGLLLASLATASAQVTVEVILDQDHFLPGEAMPVAVRIVNRSGQTLHLGTEADWLTFAVEMSDGFVVAKTGEVPVAGTFDLASSKMATVRADLAPYFNMSHVGRYTVAATVRIKNWDREINSPAKNFDVIEGARLWEQEFGVPKSGQATNAAPEVRRYILQQANYLKSQLRLYLRVTDSYGAKTFCVFPIGPMVSFGRPEPQVDKFSNLHVLYQYGSSAFSYTVFNPDGVLLIRQTYDFVNGRPRLRPDDNGNVTVVGGTRRVTDNDIPAPKYAPPAEDSPPPAAPSDVPKTPKSG